MKAKWKRRLIVAAVIAAVAVLFHAMLLRGLAGFLIVDEPTGESDCICSYSWGCGSDGKEFYDTAAQFQREKPTHRILCIAPAPNRLEQIGATPSSASIGRRELAARGVPQEAITIVRGQRWNDWANVRALKVWLRDNPNHRVLLFCDQFHSSRIRYVLDAVLDSAEAARVRVRAMQNEKYNDTNWWTSRCGYRAFGGSWLLLLQTWFVGDSPDRPAERNADAYQRDFLQALREKTP